MKVKADSMVRATQQLLQLSRALSTSLLLSKSITSDTSQHDAAPLLGATMAHQEKCVRLLSDAIAQDDFNKDQHT